MNGKQRTRKYTKKKSQEYNLPFQQDSFRWQSLHNHQHSLNRLLNYLLDYWRTTLAVEMQPAGMGATSLPLSHCWSHTLDSSSTKYADAPDRSIELNFFFGTYNGKVRFRLYFHVCYCLDKRKQLMVCLQHLPRRVPAFLTILMLVRMVE